MEKIKLSILGLLFSYNIFSQNVFIDNRELLYYTTQLSCTRLNPITHKIDTVSGTAFFFNFAQDIKYSRPYIVTNRHVIADAITGTFLLHKALPNGKPDTSVIDVSLSNFSQYWINHPNNQVDLCIMPLAPLIIEADKMGYKIYYNDLASVQIPDSSEWEKFNVIEDIKFVGYPIGLADYAHDFPIFRSGYTATPPFVDYNNKKEFLIDAPCFPGSSGSPVFIFDKKTKLSDNRKTVIEISRFYFLGVLYGGPVYTSVGTIVVQNIPTQLIPFPINNIPANLGFVIKSNVLLDFHKIISKKE